MKQLTKSLQYQFNSHILAEETGNHATIYTTLSYTYNISSYDFLRFKFKSSKKSPFRLSSGASGQWSCSTIRRSGVVKQCCNIEKQCYVSNLLFRIWLFIIKTVRLYQEREEILEWFEVHVNASLSSILSVKWYKCCSRGVKLFSLFQWM